VWFSGTSEIAAKTNRPKFWRQPPKPELTCLLIHKELVNWDQQGFAKPWHDWKPSTPVSDFFLINKDYFLTRKSRMSEKNLKKFCTCAWQLRRRSGLCKVWSTNGKMLVEDSEGFHIRDKAVGHKIRDGNKCYSHNKHFHRNLRNFAAKLLRRYIYQIHTFHKIQFYLYIWLYN
jgi:hypothetical protein